MPSPEGRAGRASALVGRAAVVASTLAALLGAPLLTSAATPTPEAAGDPRSSGQGPGLVGDPLFAIGVVVVIGVAALVVTLLWVRLTAQRESRTRR